MKRFIGEIQKRLMVFGLSNNYIYSIFGVLVSIFSMYINIIPDNILGGGNKIELLVIAFSTFMIVYKFYVETQELDERNNEFFEIDVCNYEYDGQNCAVKSESQCSGNGNIVQA